MSSKKRTSYLLALVDERAMFARSSSGAERVMMIDQELAHWGCAVDDGELVELKTVERAEPAAKKAVAPARERAVQKAPERAVNDD